MVMQEIARRDAAAQKAKDELVNAIKDIADIVNHITGHKDSDEAINIATQVVQESIGELDENGVPIEAIEYDQIISRALFEISEQEAKTLNEMEEEAYEEFDLDEEDDTEDEEFLNIAVSYKEELKAKCQNCTDKYREAIEKLTLDYKDILASTDELAESLAEIDPNTANVGEGKAFLRKMYKFRGIEPDQF